MKLPWDKNYIKIAFHVVVTVVIIYALKLCVDFIAYMITNLDEIFQGFDGFFGWLFSVCATLVIAFIIAYVFDPVVDFFQSKYDIVIKNYVFPKIKQNEKFKEVVIKSRIKKRKKKIKIKVRNLFIKKELLVQLSLLLLLSLFFMLQ